MAEPALSRDAFLSHVDKLAEEVVHVPELGGVLVRELTGAQRAKVLNAVAPAQGEKPDIGLYQRMLLQLGLVDPSDGKPLLDMTTVDKAMEMGGAKVAALCEAVERLSGLSVAAKALESAEKNSGQTPSSTSSSD